MELQADQLNQQGIDLSDRGKLDKAIMAFTTALELDPANPGIIYNLALVFYRKEDWQAAEKLLQRTLQLQPEKTDALIDLGLCFYHRGLKEKAAACYDEALEKDPMNSRCWNNRGVLSFTSGEYSRGAEEFRTAVNLDPDYSDAWFNLRDCLEELGEEKEARKAQRRWRELTHES